MSSKHYPWNILEIDETDDKKIIKKAYASLIKKYKPDEYPEEFQEIKEAYDFAIILLETNTRSETKFQDSNNDKIIDNAEFDFKTYYSDDQKVSDKLINDLNQLLLKDEKYINCIDNWETFKEYHQIYDINLKRNTGLKVLETIAKYNIRHSKNQNQPVVHLGIINYLDSIFQWNEDWQLMQSRFSTLDLKSTLYRREVAVNLNNTRTPILRRAYSMIVDITLIAFSMLFIEYLLSLYTPIKINNRILILITLLGYFIYKLIMEFYFRSHRTFGKIIVGLRILDAENSLCYSKISLYSYLYLLNIKGLSISKIKTFNRNLIVAFNFTPVFIYISGSIYKESLIFLFVIPVLLLNTIFYYSKGCLLHDILYKTRVVEAG